MKKFWWIMGLIWVTFFFTLFTDILSNRIDFNLLWLLPIGILCFFLSLLSFHVLLQDTKDTIKINNKKLWSWLSGALSIILLIVALGFLFFPSTSKRIQSSLFINDETPIVTKTSLESSETQSPLTETSIVTSIHTVEESTEETPIPKSAWFLDGCIPQSWNVFNIEGTENNGCWAFSPPIIEGTEDGFNINYLGTNPNSFLFYRKIDEKISRISFTFQVVDLKSGLYSGSTDFYFGFLPNDLADHYSTKPLSDKHNEFDGEFVLSRGMRNDDVDGYIQQGQNTYNSYDPDGDINIEAMFEYEVDIDIAGNMWNVIVENITTGLTEHIFIKNGLDVKNRYFSFGARIPQDGIINIRVFDFSVE